MTRLPHSYSFKFYKKCLTCDAWIKRRTTMCQACHRLPENADLERLVCKPADKWIRARWRPGKFSEEEQEYERSFQQASWR